MNTDKKVLACVDQSRFADYVADYAAWAAKRMNAPLELLHVLDRHPEVARKTDRSGAIGFDAQQDLLDELSSDDETLSRSARELGRMFLNRLRERAIVAGVNTPDVRLRHGQLEETLAENEDEVGLFVLGRRGESADSTQRDLGRHVEHVARSLRKPILTITDEFTEPRSVMIAFDGGKVARSGVDLVASSRLFKGLSVSLLMSGTETREGKKQLSWAEHKLRDKEFDVTASLVSGDAERIIAKAISDQGIDILIMGAYCHSPLRSLLFGSKTSDLLRAAKIPTLLLR